MHSINPMVFNLRIAVVALLLGACTAVSQSAQSTARARPSVLAQPTSAAYANGDGATDPTFPATIEPTRETLSTAQIILDLMYEGEILSESAVMVTTTSALPETPYKITLNTLTPIDPRDPNRVLAITAAALSDCHICQVRVDAAVLEKEGNGWRLESVARGLSTMGSMGHIEQGQPVEIGPNMMAVVVRGAYSSQGQYEQETAIIGSFNGQAELLFFLRDTEQYDATVAFEDCLSRTPSPMCRWGYATTLKFVPGTNPGIYDLQVVQTGTDQDGVVIDRIRVLTMTEDGYREGR